MIFDSITVGPLQCNCYILGCEKTRQAIVIDPGDEVDRILARIQKRQLHVKSILCTHAHIDHLGALEELKVQTGAEAMMHEGDMVLYQNLAMQAAWVGDPPPPIAKIEVLLRDRDHLRFGELQGEILHTPGHSPGSVCLRIADKDNYLFAGDTLFQGSIGRTDLWGGSYEEILRSIRLRLMPLDDNTVVYPGHGPATTLSQEKRLNPFLRECSAL